MKTKNWNTDAHCELFDQAAALMHWFTSQEMGPNDSIPCMTLTISQILTYHINEEADEKMIERVVDMLRSGMKLVRTLDLKEGE